LKLSLLLKTFVLSSLVFAQAVSAQEVLHVYGPGGPAPAMREAAQVFEQKTSIHVEITAGPTSAWLQQAKENADMIYSGSEHMMSDFILALEGQISSPKVEPLYLRPLALLVRPGNPKKIRGVRDLLKPGLNILVVNGAGQTGAWEDMIGRSGEIEKVKALRQNIKVAAKNSAEARQFWGQEPQLDVWIIWNIWQIANPSLADLVNIEPEYALYRDTAIVPSTRGETKPALKAFRDFLKSEQGAEIFAHWGWKKNFKAESAQ